MKNHNMLGRFRFAMQGLRATIKTERSFRSHLVAAVLVAALLLLTRPAPLWWALMLLAMAVMMTVELINTAVEKLADFIHPGQHETIGYVKDTLAAAVFMSCAAGAIVLAAFLWTELGL
jgi:diacylglycerol kinase (ATP)